MRYLSAVVLLLATTGLFTAPTLASPLDRSCDNHGIFPAEGIGSVELGAPFADTVHRLGQPIKMTVTQSNDPLQVGTRWQPITRPEDGAVGHALAQFGSPAHLLEVRALNNSVELISLYGSWDCQDLHGIHSGSPGSMVIEQYGSSYSMRRAPATISIVYNALGVQFGLTPSSSGLGNVKLVMVFLPNHFCMVWGQTLCRHYEPPLH